MSERERLIELLQNWGNKENDGVRAESIADYLLENGVVVLPCKVGDIVWINYDNYITTGKILAFYVDGVGYMVDLLVYTKEETVIGNKSIISKDYTVNDIFLTKEEAEQAIQALKGGATNEAN